MGSQMRICKEDRGEACSGGRRKPRGPGFMRRADKVVKPPQGRGCVSGSVSIGIFLFILVFFFQLAFILFLAVLDLNCCMQSLHCST